MPPEKSAFALARYSRSPDSIRDSIEWVRTHNSEKFLESFYFQYGHASIADLGHAVVCFEGVSELAATEIEAEPLWDGQAKSSRYQDFSSSGFITPPELDAAGAARYQAAGAGAAGRVPRGEPAGVRLPVRAPAAPRGHEARSLPAQSGGARLRRGALPALLGRAHQRRPGGQHPHRGKTDPAAQGVRVWRAAELGRGDRRGLRARARLPLGPERRGRTAGADAGAPRGSGTSTLCAHAATCASGPRRTCRRASQAGEPPRVDLVRPVQVAADIVATLLYPVTDRPFRELYEMACEWSERPPRRSDRCRAPIPHPPRRNSERLPRRPLRLRLRHRYRRLPRHATPPPLPEIPPGILRRARLRNARADCRSRRE